MSRKLPRVTQVARPTPCWSWWLIIGVSFLIAWLSALADSAAQEFEVLPEPQTVITTRESIVFNRLTNTFDASIGVTNMSRDALTGPLVLIVHKANIVLFPPPFPPVEVTVANPSGFDGSGDPYVYLNVVGSLAPGDKVIGVVKFNDPGLHKFTFFPVSVARVPALVPGPLAITSGHCMCTIGRAGGGCVQYQASASGTASGPVGTNVFVHFFVNNVPVPFETRVPSNPFCPFWPDVAHQGFFCQRSSSDPDTTVWSQQSSPFSVSDLSPGFQPVVTVVALTAGQITAGETQSAPLYCPASVPLQ